MRFGDESQLVLKGRVLNELMEAARDAAKEFEPGSSTGQSPMTAGESMAPSSQEIERAVMDAFEELRREKYSMSGMVPIHEIRQRIRERVGADAAGHEVLDEAMQRMRRAGRLRLVPLTDQGNVTPEQMQDAIPGEGETLFYVEILA